DDTKNEKCYPFEKRDDLMAKSFTSLDTVTKNIKENISPIPAIKQFEKIEPLKLSSNILENFIKYSNLESENERSLSPEEYFYKGVALSESGNYNEAISMYKKAIEKDPKFFRAMNNLGTVYNKLGNYLDAERELMRALEIKPNDDIILNNLGDVYSNQGKYEEAIKYFMQAIDKNKKQPKYYYNLGNIYNAIDEYDKAIEIYEKALNFDNNQAEVLNNLGISYYEKEEFLTSEKYFRQSIEADPNYLNAYHNLALIHHKNNELQQALDCYNEIIKRNPKTNLNAFYNRSCTYALLNNKSLMIEDLKKAIDINPKAKIEARTDEDFQKYRDDPDFIELTSQ
ncbi:MAG: tetratricopeptide repeat protein, partial [Candidatus Kapaibacterium sp.]